MVSVCHCIGVMKFGMNSIAYRRCITASCDGMNLILLHRHPTDSSIRLSHPSYFICVPLEIQFNLKHLLLLYVIFLPNKTKIQQLCIFQHLCSWSKLLSMIRHFFSQCAPRFVSWYFCLFEVSVFIIRHTHSVQPHKTCECYSAFLPLVDNFSSSYFCGWSWIRALIET